MAVDKPALTMAPVGVLVALLEEDVFVRMPGVEPLDRCIRVTVGTPQARRAFAQALRRVLPRINGGDQ